MSDELANVCDGCRKSCGPKNLRVYLVRQRERWVCARCAAVLDRLGAHDDAQEGSR